MDEIKILIEEVKKIIQNNKYFEDKQKITDLYNKLCSLENEKNINLVNEIDISIKALDEKYDDLFELVNMYDGIKYKLEKEIRKQEISELRMNNRKKVK